MNSDFVLSTSRDAFLRVAHHTAIAAALAGGRAALESCLNPLETTSKGIHDLVTNGDLASEKALVSILRTSFPQHALLSEEGLGAAGNGLRWVVDPIDGTTNYARGLPCWTVSVGLMDGDEYLVGAVYDPVREEMFSAWKGGGAYLNGRPIRVRETSTLDDCLFSFGLSYDSHERAQIMAVSAHMAPICMSVRDLGSAALALAYVACGRMDCYFHSHLQPWDAVGGKVILEEAGGLMTDMAGQPWTFVTRGTLAAGPNIHQTLLDMLVDLYEGD